MKKLYLALVLVLTAIVIYCLVPIKSAQSPVKGEKAYTVEEIHQREIQRKEDRRKQGYAKPDKPDEYLNYLYYLKTGNDPSKEYPHNHHLKELKSARMKSARLKASKAQLDWVERGPGNVGGRTRGFIIDPKDNTGNTWFAGSVGGGIWKTSDAGQSWVPVSDDWPNMAVSSLAIAPSNPNVLYAGTGEGFYNVDAIMGNGIFKSVDGGVTWNLLSSTEGNGAFRYVNRIAIDKDDENIIYAATNWGIYKSLDGGLSWDKVFQELYNNDRYARRVQDLRMSPSNSKVLIAGVNDYGVIQSFDGGISWKLVNAIAEGRIEVCISALDNDIMYALSSKSNLSMSVDGGDNWVDVTFSGTSTTYLGGQGWYNNTMVANPIDKTKLFIGGVDLFNVTTEEGASNGTTSFDIIDNTNTYFVYGDLEGDFLGGGIAISSDNIEGIGAIEIRFGGANSQKAHRFTVENVSAVVDAGEYAYADYVDVPFEAWDTESGKQLMVSFRDADNNGGFNLTASSLEQLVVHSSDYNATTASATIAVDGGVATDRVAMVYPKLIEGLAWEPASMVDATLVLDKIEVKAQSMTYSKISKWNADIAASDYVHADHHNLIVDTNNGNPFRLISCNDGGVAVSDDGGNGWTSPNDGYNTSQFYGVTRHPELNRYAGGLQDNGTWMSGENPENLTAWSEVAGGDGFSTVWNQSDPNKIVGCYYNNTLFGTYDGGANWVDLKSVHGYYDGDVSPFITRITNSKSNPDLLLVGSKNGISTSEDFGLSWKLVSVPAAAWSQGGYNPQTAISPVNPRYIWAGTTVSASQPLALSKDGGATYQLVSSPFDTHDANISRIIAHPTDENSAFVLFSLYGAPKIYETNDLGETWKELSGFGTSGTSNNGFPNVAVFTLIVMPHNPDIIWVGTEIGLFESTDGGNTWLYADNGLPAVCIWDMKIIGKQVVVGTHGRGVWTVDIPDLPGDIERPVVRGGKHPLGKIAVEITLARDYDKVELFIDDELNKTYTNVVAGTINEEIELVSASSKIGIQAKGIVGDAAVASNYIDIDNYTLKTPVQKYMNAFSLNKYDFIGSSFRVSRELFNDWAIHTDHPYGENEELTYVLSYPVEVLEEGKALLSYRDIALVEPGEAGTSFGDDEFWDYVVVEATKDGINWLPLADGYDVNKDSKWKAFAESDINATPNTADMFVEHTINLHDNFAEGDIILIRFRLYSDTYTVGWGWVIDDLIIQETGTSISPIKGDDNGVFRVGPNPATSFVDLILESDERGEVSVVIYDMAGRAIVVRDFYKNSANWTQQLQLGEMPKGMKIITMSINGKTYKQKLLIK
ncbi:T9SS type A sorting domain-containing protein [Carboxylicivirga mesophila]|uniref:T9SS type A sorting domain-containing protein n=1 Tax=Carboxylicivirga mesophila TaxID=1166478 RepID=A0ABS5KFN8_9BACT|nr:T9SS type A sorting domain-containing protein [Carboxylicivirga mesophila]MBS2213138.1 T9SS type A sorting domain-containing protein [Carboxylicivirga mesophila]